MTGFESDPGDEQPMHPYPCALCGRKPATGFASIGDDFYCHGDNDPEPTCYMRAQALAARDRSESWLPFPIHADPMVPPGFLEVHDEDGIVKRIQF